MKLAVMGLLARKRAACLVVDAIREIEAGTGQAALREMKLAGAEFLETEQVLASAASVL